MIAGIPTQDAIADAWAEYSAATQRLVAMEREAASSAARRAAAMKAHRLQRAFTLMSELAEIGVKLEPPLSLVRTVNGPGAAVGGTGARSHTTHQSGATPSVVLVNGGLEHGVDELPDETVGVVCDHLSALPRTRALSGVGEHGASHTMPTAVNGHLTVTVPGLGRGETL
jgi:hypothetical protein